MECLAPEQRVSGVTACRARKACLVSTAKARSKYRYRKAGDRDWQTWGALEVQPLRQANELEKGLRAFENH